MSDIPEITDFSGAVRGRLAKPETGAISLRLSQVDPGQTRSLAEKKGLSYQTYLNSIIHEGLERERRAS
jgi:predicted DNA binding CopG/RHH family protein